VNVRVRAYHPDTCGEAATLFAIYVEAVRIGAKGHYSEAQRLAWAPHTDMPEGWPDQLARLETYVAETDGEIAGFMAWEPTGYIDLAFVRPRWMGRHVAQALYDCILGRARRNDLTRLTAHASHLARAFFARNGWRVDYPEQIDRAGEVLSRFAMSLDLGEPP